MPWYLVWVLPLAALGRSAALRRVTLVFTVFLVLTFSPETGVFIDGHGLDPMSTSAGRAAMADSAEAPEVGVPHCRSSGRRVSGL